MSCCENRGYTETEFYLVKQKTPERVSECGDCGSETVDGESTQRCGYSPVICFECGYSPCDESC